MSKRSQKSVAVFAAVMSFLLVFLLVFDYAIGVRSDAMRFARSEIAQSEALKASIGEISSVELRKLWGYGAQPGASDSGTRLAVIAVGERGERELTVHLKKNGGRWVIVESSEPL
jgi:hypothetical protein